MPRQYSYLLRQPTIALCKARDGSKRFLTLPAGAALHLINHPAENSPLLELDWDDSVVVMFRQHLEERATRIE